MIGSQLILGIDGGGSKTLAWLADIATATSPPRVIGRGSAGASNPQSVGITQSLLVLQQAVDAAFSGAQRPRETVAAACLALAGADREPERTLLAEWANTSGLAHRFRYVNDAFPILAAASEKGWGIGLISGTGSLAFGVNSVGDTARAGGWGYLLGDDGSGYWIGLSALRAVAKAADGCGPETTLVARVLETLQISRSQDLIARVYQDDRQRQTIAALSTVVSDCASAGDVVASEIIQQAGVDLAHMVCAVVDRLELRSTAFPLGLTGGVLVHQPLVRKGLLRALKGQGVLVDPVRIITQPVEGTVRIACEDARR